MSGDQNPKVVPHPTRQAPVAPVADDGVKALAIGTAAFIILTVVVASGGDANPTNKSWYLWVCLAGVAIGPAGLLFCLWRRLTKPSGQR